MISGWGRTLTGLGLAVAGVLLSGCHAKGTFDVLSAERVAVDLTISGSNLSCPHGADELKLVVTTVTDEFGDPVCHVTGETQATYFSTFGIDVAAAAEYLVLEANLAGGRNSWPTADILVRFPGRIVDATQGEVEGNAVHITDLGALSQGSGLRVVGLGDPGPPAWVLPALAGAGAGALVVLVVWATVWLVRRPARPALVGPDEGEWPLLDDAKPAQETFAPVNGSEAPGAPAPPETAPDPAIDGQRDTRAPDTSWFARPPTEAMAPGDGGRSGSG